jgi:hypothetical protein
MNFFRASYGFEANKTEVGKIQNPYTRDTPASLQLPLEK